MVLSKLLLITVSISLVLVPSIGTVTTRDYSSSNYVLTIFLIESIEDYSRTNRNNLPRSHDAAQAFINEFSRTGVSITWLKDSNAWQEDWWTAEANGYNIISWYHISIFIGHGASGGTIYFGRYANRTGRQDTDRVDFTAWVGMKNSPEVHPKWRSKWIVLASCKTLKDDNAWKPGYPAYLIASRTFNGRKDNVWDWNDMYLHVIVGMYSNFLQQDGWGIDYASPTLQSFAHNLKNKYSILNSWFKAVEDHQRICYGSYCTWTGKAAAIAPFIEVYDRDGDFVASYYYSSETLSSVYQRPIELVNMYLQQGYRVILGWAYYRQ